MHGTQTTPISKRRIVGVVFTLAAGMLAVYFAVESVRYYRQLSKWQVAEPTHFPADLSRVGTFEGPFIQMCQISHGESIILKLPDLRDASPSLLEGLRGRLEIVGSDGAAVLSSDLALLRPAETSWPGAAFEIPIFIHSTRALTRCVFT